MEELEITSFPASLNVLQPVVELGISQTNAAIKTLDPNSPVEITKYEAALTTFYVGAPEIQITSLFPVVEGVAKKYLMRCKNLSNGQPVYWLSDFLDKNGTESGLPSIDIGDVCLIEVVC